MDDEVTTDEREGLEHRAWLHADEVDVDALLAPKGEHGIPAPLWERLRERFAA